jgi:hypothetical protein
MPRGHLNYARAVLATFAARRLRLVVAMALLAPLACLGAVSSSWASEHHPTGGYAPFADCPLIDPSLVGCFLAVEPSGEFVVGRKTVPIDRLLTIQGGFVEGTGEFDALVGAEDGNTLSKTALSVPGGLTGILAPGYLPASLRGQFDESIGKGVTGVTMTPEIAGPASAIELSFEHLLSGEGVAVRLPLKIKLSNPFLGGDCYIGSSANPIVVNFTAGATDPPAPNKSISGVVGNSEFEEEFTLIAVTGNSLVDNTFAVPRATGCGGSLSAFVDSAVDAQLGLPSSAGHNTAIMDGTIEQVNSNAVRKSE